MQLDIAKCCGCSYCVLVCPRDAIKSYGGVEILENCNQCMLCAGACPTGALTKNA